MDSEQLQSFCLFSTATIKDAIKRLNDTGRRILFVTDSNQRLIGTVADGDIRRGLLAGYGFGEPVEKIVHRDYIAIAYDSLNTKARAKELMIKHNIQTIPLVDHLERVRDVVFWIDIFGDQDNQNTMKIRHIHDNEAVIMAGGKGSRLDVFTKVFPKPLIPVGDRPAIELIMERFYKYGFHKFLYTLNYKKEYIKLFLKENHFPFDYKIDWVEEQEFLGTAGSLSLLQHRLNDTFFVVNCDTLLDVDYAEILAWHRDRSAAITIIGCHNEVDIPFGVVALANGKLEKIHEKPSHDVIINTGMYIMEPRALAYLNPGTPIDMNELINKVAEKEDVNVYPVYGRDWLDLGQWDAYKRSSQLLEDKGMPT